MEREYIAAIIGVAGTAVGTVLGFLLTLLYERFKESSRIKAEFEELKSAVVLGVTSNEIPKNLNALRRFYIRNCYRVRNEAFDQFYGKWLHDPTVEMGRSEIYDDRKRQAMLEELERVKL